MKRKVKCICGQVYDFNLALSTYKRCKKCRHRLVYLDHLLGQRIGDYTIGSPICTGNHGTVFHVENRPEIVIKILSETARAAARVPVLEEIRSKKIKHPNILYPLAFGLYNNFLWYTVSYCEGTKLRQTSAETWGSMPDRRKVQLIEELIEVPMLLEKHNLLHRDMQESNIIFSEKKLKVIDIDSINFEDRAYDDLGIVQEKKRHYFYRLTWMLILMFSNESFDMINRLRKSKDVKKIEGFIADKRFDQIRSVIQPALHEEICRIKSFKQLKCNIAKLKEAL